MAPSATETHLLWYLENYLSSEVTIEPWHSHHHLPWNRAPCLFVLTYIAQFCSNVDHSEFSHSIMALDQIAKSVHASYVKQTGDDDNDHSGGGGGGDLISKKNKNQEVYVDENNKKQQEFSEMLVNSFVPDVVPTFFTVPKLHQLPDKDRHLKTNEILAGFLDFLLQVLYHESNTSEREKQLYALDPLQKNLSFLLAVLGDIPFQSSHHELAEDVANLLVEFEILANEAGILVYDSIFHIHHLVDTSRFHVRGSALSEKFEILNAKIKEHCIKFAELPLSVISRSGVVDSFFIIHSLIGDIENLMNGRFNITHDDSIKSQFETLNGELTLVQTFINDSEGLIEEKEAFIQIRDLAYEVEYLISSHIVGNMPVWYLNARLQSVVQKIKLAHVGLQQNSEMHDSKAISAFDNELPFRRTEDHVPMDDNYFMDFYSDITQKILEDLIRKEEEEEEEEEDDDDDDDDEKEEEDEEESEDKEEEVDEEDEEEESEDKEEEVGDEDEEEESEDKEEEVDEEDGVEESEDKEEEVDEEDEEEDKEEEVDEEDEEEESEDNEEDEEEEDTIISIVGVPGIGKTTIATKLYNCKEAFDHFDLRVWCAVSETFSMINLYFQILMCVESDTDKDTLSTKNALELREGIREILHGKRYLIVMDDVWDSNWWSHLRRCLPNNRNGSMLLITSTIKNIAPAGSTLHEVPFLSDDQCWDLLVKKVFLDDPCPPQLLSIGKRIASRCSGILLAVISTADILVHLEKEISVWETVEEQLDTLLLDGQSNYRKMLELRYKSLPHVMKPCFLYFATFPKDAEISKKQLARMWVSQGYIEKHKKKSQEKTAKMYLLDMIKRRLVLATKWGTGGEIKTVKIDDMLHEFCARKAKEENIVKSTNGFSVYEKHQHLRLPSAASGFSLRPFGLHCRSLGGCSSNQSSCFRTMPLLKVMDLSPNEYSSHQYPRYDLPVQLRYLSIGVLQKGMVDNLVNLEFFYVKSNKTVVIPSVVLRMAKLKHLIIEPSAEFDEDCSISETSKLRSLSFVCIGGGKQKDGEILRHLQYLKTLKCIYGGAAIIPDMDNLWRLVSLKICFEVSKTNITVPNFNIPFQIRKLSLSGAVLTGNHMSIIEELSFLQVLKLENHAFVGDKWEVRNYKFLELKVLKIESRDLREWSCGSGSFRKLERLVLTGCTKLEEIYFSTKPLERLEVMKCGVGVYFWLAMEIYDDRRFARKLVTDKNIKESVLQGIKLHDEETLPDTPSTEHLKKYLKQEYMPTKWDTCTFVVHYVLQFLSNVDNREFHDVVTGLDRIARSYWEREYYIKGYDCYSYEMEKKREEFSELFMNSFIPEVQKFFKVSKLHQLSDKDKHLNQNEILAGFIDFLIQVLHRENNISSGEEQIYNLFRNQLSFHLAVLGDIPFQSTHPGLEEQVNNLLEEFEFLGNEAGSFIYSCVFSIRTIDADWIYAETVNLIVKAEFLNASIKHHCNIFSELPMSVVPRPVVDSIFIIDSLIEDIDNLENREINFPDDNEKKNQIGMLKDELNISNSVIKLIDRIPPAPDANEQKEDLVLIRALAYQAEYLINSHVVGNIAAWYLNLRLPSIVQEIKIVNERLQQLVKKVQDSNVLIKASDGEASSRTRANPATTGENDFLTFNDGMEQNILGDLIRRLKTSRHIILLSGMPGLGKTTTATKLYNRQEVSEYFDRRAWCTVSQDYSLRELFVQILRDIASDHENIDLAERLTAKLGLNIHKTLYGKRYLIVLDDVWESNVLDKMIRYLPDDKNGSRVIVTSRVTGVAPDDSIFYELPLLSNDQCWGLLKKKVFPYPKVMSCPLELEDVGKQIAEKCCGLPLAVVSTAGILANLEMERSVWENVGKQLDVLLLEDQRNYRKILELSYENLPRNLKPCFLYFATFPEDAEISKKRLTWMWIAGRFIPKEGNKDPEEIAETYFLDLINRNLVMTAKRGSDGRIRTCKIHDLLHDICVAKANEQNFVKSTNVFSIYEKHQGLSLPSTTDIILRPFGHHCRSFRDSRSNKSGYLRTMPLLKTVELPMRYCSDRFDVPDQLRYLSIGDLQKSTVANLVSLEFVHVRGGVVVVPSVIIGMGKLKHLDVRKIAKFARDCNISEETSLRSLSYVCLDVKKDQDILRHSPHLRKLKCKISREILFPDISALAKLESLRINNELRFSGQLLLLEASFPSTIKKLCLKRSKLPWEKMTIIGKLPKLEVLKLEWDAFVGDEWETNDDEFQELKFLKIECPAMKQWTSESSHFPRLEQLVMHNCRQLQGIPSDLGYIQSLQKIVLWRCIVWAISSAENIEEEQRENENTQLQVYTSEPVSVDSLMTGNGCVMG